MSLIKNKFMRHALFLLALSFISFFSKAQNVKDILVVDQPIICVGQVSPDVLAQAVETDTTIFRLAEEMPAFPGGEAALLNYIKTNLVYPKEALDKEVQGRVMIRFVVNKDGSVSDIVCLRGLGYGCDEEAERLVLSMPKWKPGKINGKVVRVYYQMPIRFVLE